MKKRTAMILCGALVCSMGGYVAWCFRCFYLAPGFKFDASVSPGGREAVEKWRWSANRAPAMEFNRQVAWYNLRNPWHCKMGEVLEVIEVPDEGLWARNLWDKWGFSRTGNEWDASTAFRSQRPPTFSYSPLSRRIDRQAWIASRIDMWGASGVKVEVLSLGPQTTYGKNLREVGMGLWLGPNAEGFFCGHVVLGRITLTDGGERQSLLDAFARSAREADVDVELPRWCVFPKLGIILTQGDVRAEYLVSYEDGDAYGSEDAMGDAGGFYEGFDVHNGKRFDWKESQSYFRLSPRYQGVFDEVLAKHGIERVDAVE